MYSKLSRFGIICLMGTLVVSCNNKSDKKEPKADTTSTVVDGVDPKSMAPRLFCKTNAEDSLGTPHADVMLYANGNETKIASTNACAEISKADYKTYEIPGNALAAVGGWWAGGGSYYYLIEKEGKFVVFEGWAEEGQEDTGYHWKEWVTK